MFKIGDLEAACTSVLAPPQFTTPQKRRDAEEFLIDFREKASKNHMTSFFYFFKSFSYHIQLISVKPVKFGNFRIIGFLVLKRPRCFGCYQLPIPLPTSGLNWKFE